MRHLATGLATALVGVLCGQLSARAQTNVLPGEVTASVTWSGTNLLAGTVTIRPAARVTIDAGTVLLMGTAAVLRVEGQLLANGTPDNPIRFTRAAVGSRWKQIRFHAAAASRFGHCVFEFADSAGSHLDYYDTDCDPGTPAPPRNYHEAIVVLASRVDFEGCTFHRLPDDTAGGEGDALAIISDDPEVPGAASAEIRNCQFLSIGQGIHTRFSHVLVEGCYFTGKHGDNDDIDLYGESTPPPLIRYNRLVNPGHDDMINPTRCSAILVGNLVSGGDDHGIVLRDRCAPVLINNIIADCANGGIAIQNQCDALLVNNTIINCGRGLRLFDHTTRWGPPYCLSPGSGHVTLVNSIVWNCPTTFDLEDSPFAADPGSHVTVLHSLVQGGTTNARVSAHSTFAWGPGNLTEDPRLDPSFRPQTGSPAIDAATNAAAWIGDPQLVPYLALDQDQVPRPLDGNGDGTAAPDLGAMELLLAGADSNRDGIPDGWCWRYGLNPADLHMAAADPDDDGHTTLQEWTADTDPTNGASVLRLTATRDETNATVTFDGSTSRRYTLFRTTGQPAGTAWEPVPGQVDIPGRGARQQLAVGLTNLPLYLRVGVRMPD